MKILTIILIFVSFNAKTLTLSSARSVPEGNSIQTFSFGDKILKYKKGSNYFDLKKEMRIGEFHAENSPEILEQKNKIESVLVEVKRVDHFLLGRGSSFNKLSGPILHGPVFYLDDFVIRPNSIHYSKLKEAFTGLQRVPLKQHSGIELTKDVKELLIIQNGTILKKESFNMNFYCQKGKAPTICGYKDVGILYIE